LVAGRARPGIVDDVIIGCVGQNLEQSATPGQAWLAAGFPEHVPSVTIERKCGSGQQATSRRGRDRRGAVRHRYRWRVESMSRVPIMSARMGADPHARRRRANFLVRRGCPPNCRPPLGLSRTTLDTYAVRRTPALPPPPPPGGFDDAGGGDPPGAAPVSADESIRPGTTPGVPSRPRGGLGTDEMRARFPLTSTGQ
jgi:hypothetical protein